MFGTIFNTIDNTINNVIFDELVPSSHPGCNILYNKKHNILVYQSHDYDYIKYGMAPNGDIGTIAFYYIEETKKCSILQKYINITFYDDNILCPKYIVDENQEPSIDKTEKFIANIDDDINNMLNNNVKLNTVNVYKLYKTLPIIDSNIYSFSLLAEI